MDILQVDNKSVMFTNIIDTFEKTIWRRHVFVVLFLLPTVGGVAVVPGGSLEASRKVGRNGCRAWKVIWIERQTE